jgi:hypothetical protein
MLVGEATIRNQCSVRQYIHHVKRREPSYLPTQIIKCHWKVEGSMDVCKYCGKIRLFYAKTELARRHKYWCCCSCYCCCRWWWWWWQRLQFPSLHIFILVLKYGHDFHCCELSNLYVFMLCEIWILYPCTWWSYQSPNTFRTDQFHKLGVTGVNFLWFVNISTMH